MKTKYPRREAMEVAAALCEELEPYTHRIVVAGSLRRMKEFVGDIEILFVPMFETRKRDLLDIETFDSASEQIDRMVRNGILFKRPNAKGGFSWGAKNKLAVHRSGIPVDLFTATHANWYNYMVCRTGPGDSNIRICNAAIAKGWKWCPYGDGFERPGTGEKHIVTSEKEVFDFVGLPYNEPHKRT
jgi:DNA polymerase/3'-5' exonuclease PolX